MNPKSRFSIKNKIFLNFTVVTLLVLSMIVTGYFLLGKSKQLTNDIIPETKQIALLENFHQTFSDLEASVEMMFITSSPEYFEIGTDLHGDLQVLLLELIEEPGSQSDEFINLSHELGSLRSSLIIFFDTSNSNLGFTSSRDRNLLIKNIYNQINLINKHSANTLTTLIDDISADVLLNQKIISDVLVQFLIIGALILCLEIIIGVRLVNAISNPVVDLRDAVNKFRKGELKGKVKINFNDEIGDLTSSFNYMSSDIRKYQHDLNEKINIISKELKRRKLVEKKLKKSQQKLAQSYEETQAQNEELETGNADLVRTQNKLEDSLRDKSDFLNRIAHDLRTPLTPITVLLQVIRKHNSFPAKMKKNFEVIAKNVNSLSYLVTELLSLARLDSRAFEIIRPTKVDLHQFLNELIDKHSPVFNKEKIKLTVDVDKDIPTIYLDEDKITQIFGNIFSNAIKHFESAPKKLKISISKVKNGVSFRVLDNGAGIAKNNLKKVFNEFFQVDQFQGGTSSGLGLAICKRIIMLHKGKIWAESEGLGKGTTIAFTLPLGK